MSGPDAPRVPKPFRLAPPVVVGLGVFLFALLFALYTRHAWEDWYITFRPAKNLATGQGLVYNPGERVHSFTSVIGTLLPALLSFLTFNVSDDLTLWLFRIACAAALGVSAALLVKASRVWFAGLGPAVLLVGAAATDSKTVDFSVNGMETPFTLLGLTLFLYFTTMLPKRELGFRLGTVWALLQYTRPDGFIYSLLLMSALLLFQGDRRETLRMLAVSCAFAAALFAPWFLFATWYYGSAVPHSLIAKRAWMAAAGAPFYLDRVVEFMRSLILLREGVFDALFTPPYAATFRLLEPALLVSRALGAMACFVWIFPRVGFAGRAASLACLGQLFYLSAFTPLVYPWYVPGATWLALTALAFGFDALRRHLAALGVSAKWIRDGSLLAVAGMLAYVLLQTAITAHQFRFAQQAIEEGQRRQIGEWLKAHAASPHETVFLECAGYIGFFSGLKLYDYPGMTSPEMVSTRMTLRSEEFLPLVKALRPDWLVLRPEPGELNGMWNADSVFLKRHYVVMKAFDVGDAINRESFKPFERLFRHDARFVVAKRVQ
jgi:hypothetical protein